jgi:hypothetical protein
LTIATAGDLAEFTIIAKDHLGNPTTLGSDIFAVRARPPIFSGFRDQHGTVFQTNGGQYKATYTPLFKSNELSSQPFHDLYVQLLVGGGLMATYYQGLTTFQVPALTTLKPTMSESLSLTTSALKLVSILPLSVRYKGYVSLPSAQRYTFWAGPCRVFERVRLWIDNALIVDQWSSLATTTPSGVLVTYRQGLMYSTTLEYIQISNTSSSSLLALEQSTQSGVSLIPSSRLFQAHDISLSLSSGQQGLFATYYAGIPAGSNEVGGFNAVKSMVEEQGIDWSFSGRTNRPYDASLPLGAFSVRWLGFIIPSRTDEYTFTAQLYGSVLTSERVSVWLDEQNIIDQWSSLSSSNPSATITFPYSDQYYNILVFYKSADANQTNKGLSLAWNNLGGSLPLFDKPLPNESTLVNYSVPSSSRLRPARTMSKIQRDDFRIWDTDSYDPSAPFNQNPAVLRTGLWDRLSGCPRIPGSRAYSLCRGRGIRENFPALVDVKPGPLCATLSSVLGPALSIATAGVTRTFTLTARDSYDNQRDALDDSFIARATLSTALVHSAISPQSWKNLFDPPNNEINNPPKDFGGKYEGSYISTISGAYSMRVHAVQQNGLMGMYFAGSNDVCFQNLSIPRISRVDPIINFDWGLNIPIEQKSSEHVFSVKWTGLFRAPQSGEYTFFGVSDGDLRLTIDGNIVFELSVNGSAKPDVMSGEPEDNFEEILDKQVFGSKIIQMG